MHVGCNISILVISAVNDHIVVHMSMFMHTCTDWLQWQENCVYATSCAPERLFSNLGRIDIHLNPDKVKVVVVFFVHIVSYVCSIYALKNCSG